MTISFNQPQEYLIYITIQIPGIPLDTALLDSGLAANILHSKLTEHMKVEEVSPVVLTAPDGTFLATVTSTVAIYWPEIKEEITLLVADFSSFPLILGSSVAKKFLKLPNGIQFALGPTPKIEEIIITEKGEGDNKTPLDQEQLDKTDANSITSETVDTDFDSDFPEEEYASELESSYLSTIHPISLLSLQRKSKESRLTPLYVATVQLGNKAHTSNSIDEFITQLHQDFKEILSDQPLQSSDFTSEVEHKIELIDPKKVAYTRPYKIPIKFEQEVNRQIQVYLDQGFIEPSNSPFNAPLICVPKLDGSIRLCNDFRALNNNTVKDRYLLPNLEDLLAKVGAHQYYTILDMVQGYHQIPIRPADRHMTAFLVYGGTYCWIRVPFGLCNAPATFQRHIHQILRPYLDKFVTAYLDDIVIFSDNFKDHQSHVRQVLQLLQHNGIRLKAKKCEFFKKSVKFLGHELNQLGVAPALDKVAVIQDFPIPTTPSAMRSFIGFVGFYRRYIYGFSQLIRPLNSFACQKESMSPAVEEAFGKLKDRLTQAPTLVPPEVNAQYIITTDASDYAIGAVIEKRGTDGKARGVIAYFSAMLATNESHYSVREKELLACIKVLKRYEHLLIGHPITIQTDHHSLQYLLTSKSPPSPRLMRWYEFLSGFDINIEYIKGSTNKADLLSRDFTASLRVATISMPFINQPLGDDFKSRLLQGYKEDERCSLIYSTLVNKLKVPKSIYNSIKFYYVRDDLLFFKGSDTLGQLNERLYIPTPTLQFEVIRLHHSSPTATHYGPLKVYAELAQYYYWPAMLQQLRVFTKNCHKCQSIKPTNRHEFGLLRPPDVATSRWSSITMDFITGFRKVGEVDCIWVITDRFTKRCHFIPISKSITAEQLAQLFIVEIFRHHGMPLEIISDRDVLFTSRYWKSFFHALGTKLKLSTPAHPKTDGSTERANRSLIQLLRAMFTYDTDAWVDQLPILEFSYNSHVHSAIGMTPFTADLGYTPSAPHVDTRIATTTDNHPATLSGTNLAKLLEQQNKLITDRLLQSQTVAEKAYNRHREELLLEVGDLVLVHRNAKVLSSTFKFAKQYNLYFGPYRVAKKFDDNPNVVEIDFGLNHGQAGQASRLTNVKNLRPYYSDENNNYRLPPKTKSELVEFSRNKWITAMVGIDFVNKSVALTFHNCPEFHASIFKLSDAISAIDPTYWESLVSKFRFSTEDLSSHYSTDINHNDP